MNTEYQTNISDKRWWAYDIPGNIGWIIYLIGSIRAFKERKSNGSIVALVPTGFMLVGVAELISERIAGLDRILSGKRLFRGFGALTAGGLLGIPAALFCFKKNRKRQALMLTGSALCAVFAGLLFAGYKKE